VACERLLIREKEEPLAAGTAIDEPKSVSNATRYLGERRGKADVVVARAVGTDAELTDVLRLQARSAMLAEEPAFDRRDGERFDRGDITHTRETREQRQVQRAA
jgi:hypothetical protein